MKKQLDYLVQHNEFLTEEDDPPSSTSNTTMENQSSYQGTIMQGKPSLETRSMTSYQSTMNDNDSVHSFNSNSNIPTSDIMIKCYDSLENQSDATILRFSPEDELTLQKVKMEVLSRKPILSSTNQIQLKYKDEDDDIITLKKEDDFKLCLANYRNSGQRYLKLYISSNISLPTNKSSPTISSSLRDSNEESSELIQILEGMVDAIVVMTANDKLIKYVNKAAETLLNYTKEELVGYNVTKIMPSAYRQNHDQYVDTYVKTGIAKIINKGRLVPVKNKGGKVFDCWLSVSDSSWGNQRAFTGTLKMIYSNNNTQTTAVSTQPKLTRFPFLENMVDGVIILSGNDDIIRYFNKSAEQMFGYTREEVVGQTINILIADETVRPKHNQYVRRYMEQGDAHIVGTGRRVEAITKDGKILPVYLSVNETKWNSGQDGRCFIGTVKSLLEENNLSQYMK